MTHELNCAMDEICLGESEPEAGSSLELSLGDIEPSEGSDYETGTGTGAESVWVAPFGLPKEQGMRRVCCEMSRHPPLQSVASPLPYIGARRLSEQAIEPLQPSNEDSKQAQPETAPKRRRRRSGVRRRRKQNRKKLLESLQNYQTVVVGPDQLGRYVMMTVPTSEPAQQGSAPSPLNMIQDVYQRSLQLHNQMQQQQQQRCLLQQWDRYALSPVARTPSVVGSNGAPLPSRINTSSVDWDVRPRPDLSPTKPPHWDALQRHDLELRRRVEQLDQHRRIYCQPRYATPQPQQQCHAFGGKLSVRLSDVFLQD